MDVADLDWRKSTRSADQGNCVEITIVEDGGE
ncbi:DUF397 domain-containing protein [Actinoallomurus iriomotensis]|nr:DUF397 domain-containing protein [Actinoallomurus iriomotensis]